MAAISRSKRKTMRGYVVLRLLQAIPAIFAIIVLAFILVHATPGDPTYLLVGETSDPKLIEQIRKNFGLDRPLHEQLFLYIVQVLQGNLGNSYWFGAPVLTVILERVPATLLLMSVSLIFAVGLGIPLGVRSSKKPYSLTDNIVTVASLVGYSVPLFWLGQIFIIIFALWLGLFPFGGLTSVPTDQMTTPSGILDILRHLILPALGLGSSQLALIFRLTRANMLEVLDQDYMLTARAKGLKENEIIYGHALRNALLPIVTVIGLNIAFMFAGAILTETVFTWPGLGRLMFDSLTRRDYPMIMGLFIFISVVVIVVTVITDLAYAYLDPRVRYR